MRDVQWDDVAAQMAEDTGKTVDDPSVVEAIEALRTTKLRPAFVLDEWRAAAGDSASREGDT